MFVFLCARVRVCVTVCVCVCGFVLSQQCSSAAPGKVRVRAAAAKKASQTRADAKWQLCISLTGTDSWQMDSTHTPQEKRQERAWGRVRYGKMEREEKAPRMIRQHCSLFRGPAFDWVLQRIINPPLPSAVPSFLSLLISRFPSLSL